MLTATILVLSVTCLFMLLSLYLMKKRIDRTTEALSDMLEIQKKLNESDVVLWDRVNTLSLIVWKG